MKLWIVVLQDKDLYLEPDVGVTFVESDIEQDAIDAGVAMQDAARDNGRCRCVARHREVERDFRYRTTALFRTPERT